MADNQIAEAGQETQEQVESAPEVSETATQMSDAVEAANASAAVTTARTRELSNKQVAAIKRHARDDGRAVVEQQMLDKALAMGYQSIDEMIASVPPRKVQPTPSETPGTPKRIAKVFGSENPEELIGRYERQLQKYKDKVASLEAEVEFRNRAYDAGATDVDYVVNALDRTISKLKPTELDKFSFDDFFGDMKKKKPYLFRDSEPVREVPVSTSRAQEAAKPKQDEPVAVESKAAETKVVDATKMTREEYKKYLESRGLRTASYMV